MMFPDPFYPLQLDNAKSSEMYEIACNDDCCNFIYTKQHVRVSCAKTVSLQDIYLVISRGDLTKWFIILLGNLVHTTTNQLMELPVQMATDRVCLASGIVFCYCDPRAIRRQLAEWNCLVQYPVHGQDQNFNKQKKKTNFYSYLTDRHAAYFSLHWMSDLTKRDKAEKIILYLRGRSRV